jgi:hypothetical protein
MGLPYKIFQTWKSTELPSNFAYWANTFTTYNPDCEYVLWDDADNRNFITEYFPWFLDRYNNFPSEIYRADAVRYFYLYVNGGIYADLDTECLHSLSPVLDAEGDVVLGRMGTNITHDLSLPNAFMISKPRQEFWLLVMSLLMTGEGDPRITTGSAMLKKAYEAYETQYREDVVQQRLEAIRTILGDKMMPADGKSNIVVASPNSFFPIDSTDRIHENFFTAPLLLQGKTLDSQSMAALFPTSFTVPFWARTWSSDTNFKS